MKAFTLLTVGGLILATLLAWTIPQLTAKPDRFELGLRLLEQDKAEQAVHLFDSPEWRGVAQYRAQRYRRSVAEFFQSKDVANFYNLGNAYAQVHEWAGATAAYERALRLDAGHADAQFNLDLVRRAEALELALLDESRESRAVGNWQDGDREIPTPADINSSNLEQGTPEGGAFRPAAADAEASGESELEGRTGDAATARDAKASIASGSPEDAQSEGELTGAGASVLLRQSRQNAELLLRTIEDKPERVLRARLAAAHKQRTEATVKLSGDQKR